MSIKRIPAHNAGIFVAPRQVAYISIINMAWCEYCFNMPVEGKNNTDTVQIVNSEWGIASELWAGKLAVHVAYASCWLPNKSARDGPAVGFISVLLLYYSILFGEFMSRA